MKTIRIQLFAAAALMLSLAACDKFLERKPEGLLPEEAIQTPQDLQEVLNSIYDIMANTYNGTIQNVGELISDNLDRPVQNDDYTEVWQRNTNFFNGSVGFAFRQCYRIVLRSNTVIDASNKVSGLTASAQVRTEAEARFLRALAHFEVVRLFAQPYGATPNNTHLGVAIRTTTAPDALPRSTVAEVYNQVLADLQFAEANLPESNGVYATKWSAKALLCRVYFQMQDYELAALYANDVISNGPFSLGTTPTFYTWPQVSPEAIFVVYSAPRGDEVSDNRSGGLRGNYSTLGITTLRITQEFFVGTQNSTGPRSSLFESDTQEDITFYRTNMFNEVNFHIPILSLTEMHLTRAEAYAYLGVNLNAAKDDINAIRERAYGTDVLNLGDNPTPDAVKAAARLERRYELAFTGDRVQQLKRRGVEGENIIVRGAPWNCPGMVIQFPVTEQVDGFPLNPTGGCN
jgi:hypothetical protein